jgi:polysaccharide biosynthesis/export protein
MRYPMAPTWHRVHGFAGRHLIGLRLPRRYREMVSKSVAIIAVLFGLFVACVGSVQAQEPSAAEAGAAPPPESSNTYRIGPGDVLQVFVWRNPELSTSVPVRPDGRISTPLVENMVAVGKTPSQLARDMEKVLAEYVRSPKVNIIVTQPVSTFSQVRVVGQVVKPQAVPYREGMTVLDVVLQVGGLGPYAAGNRSKVVRTDAGKSQEIPVRLSDLVNKGKMTENIPMKPGDVLVVPESRF